MKIPRFALALAAAAALFAQEAPKEKGRVQKALEKVGKGVDTAASKTVDASKTAAGKTADTTKTAAGKTADATKTAAGKTADATKTAAGKTADATKTAAGKTADTTKTAAGKTADATGSGLSRAGEAVKTAGDLDINTATAADLKKLPGIGDAYAEKIIAARPYRAKNELADKGVIPESVYAKIRDKIVARQPK